MHELAVTQGIVSVAVEAAQQAGGERILAIDLVIGDLSSIVDESVQFYFDFLSQGTLAEGAVLRFRRTSAQASCFDCGHQFAVSVPLLAVCPVCDSAHLQVTGGQEFYIESIEVDDENSRGEGDTQRK